MVTEINSTVLNKFIKSGREIIIIDSRDPSDYKISHIKNSISLLLGDVDEKAAIMLKKNTPVIVYSNDIDCPASGLVSEKIEKMGYGPVYNYNPSFKDWVEKGYPVVS